MNKTFVFIATLAAAISASPVRAATYPALETYRALAQELMASTEAVKTPSDLEGIRARTQDLMKMGVEIMDLYASKNPACQTQFDAMIREYGQIETMSEADAHKRYHDAVGLPAAPKHCYFGRSQVIHPALVLIRLKGQWSESVRESMLDEYGEVIGHLKRIQKNLDTPPN